MIKKFAKDVIIYGLSSSLTKLVGLFLIPLYTRIFSIDNYGIMDIVVTIVAIATIFGLLQLESAVARYYYLEKNDGIRTKMVSTALWSIIIFSFLITGFLTLLSGFLSNILFKSDSYATTIVIGCLTISVSNITSFLTVIIQFKKKPLHYLTFQLIQIAVTIGLTLFLIMYIGTGIIGVFWGQFIGFLVISIIMGIYLRKELTFAWDYTSFNKMMRYSLPLVPAVAGSIANSYVNRFIILGYLTIAEIGIYAVALKIASVFQLIGTAFRMAWMPFFWETFENNSDHKKIFKNVQKTLSILAFIGVVLLTIFSREVTHLLASNEYFSATKYVGLISLSIAITSIIMPVTGIGPGITKRTEYNTIIYFIGLSVNIVSLFLFVPTLGLLGVPLSLLVGNIVTLAIGWYNSEKLYYIGFDKIASIIYLCATIIIIIINMYYDPPFGVKLVIVLFLIMYLFIKYAGMIKAFLKNQVVQG
jgi:O-antigen/teichoic acid export membrane protein